MSDPFRMYEAARKLMYSAMERESDPAAARRGYEQAMDGFTQFLTAAAKNRGMYRELVRVVYPAQGTLTACTLRRCASFRACWRCSLSPASTSPLTRGLCSCPTGEEGSPNARNMQAEVAESWVREGGYSKAAKWDGSGKSGPKRVCCCARTIADPAEFAGSIFPRPAAGPE
jgi:hypothetical protein